MRCRMEGRMELAPPSFLLWWLHPVAGTGKLGPFISLPPLSARNLSCLADERG